MSFLANTLLGRPAHLTLTGAATNIAVAATSRLGATIAARIIALNPADKLVAVHLDGALALTYPIPADASDLISDPADTPHNFTRDIANLTPGAHTLQLSVIRDGAPVPDRHGDPLGQRAYLAWAPSPDPTTAAYRVYSDLGSHATPDTLVATLSAPTIVSRTAIPPDNEPTHTARVTFAGSFSAVASVAALNATLTITIAAPTTNPDLTTTGAFTYLLASLPDATDLTGSSTFSAGDTVTLPYGLTVTFLDDPEDYTEADTYATTIGPPATYLSDVLSPDTYCFAVAAIDAAGNESTPIAAPALRVVPLPEPVTSVTLTHADADPPDAETLTIAWTDSADITAVNLYTNFNPQTNTLVPDLYEAAPLASVAAGVELYAFEPPAGLAGTLLIALRPTTAIGIELPDLTLHTFTFPPTPADLGIVLADPTDILATPAAAGRASLAWSYAYRPGDDLDHFHVWIQTGVTVDHAQPPTATILATAGTGFPTAAFTYTSAILSATAAISIRSSTSTGVLSPIITPTLFTPDATAPTPPSLPTSTPQ